MPLLPQTKPRRLFIVLSIFLLGILLFLFWWTNPVFFQVGTIKVWDRNNILLYESAGTVGKNTHITYEEFPKQLVNAVIASEDNSFWENKGVDGAAILRSLYINIKAGRVVSGASTITQQLARTAIISPQQKPARSLVRKLREILVALRLTFAYSKQEILTRYLNQVYFGNLAYGVQAASETYFDKDASQLSLAESAFLVGLLSSPDRRNPFTNLPEAKKEQAEVLDAMVKQGFISQEEAEAAGQEELALIKKHREIKAPHFVQYVLQELDSLQVPVQQGVNVYTTLDYHVFSLSENVAKIWLDRLSTKHDVSNAALVLIDNQSGEILTMLGGVDYFDATHSGQVNMATALRQPGSALKPVTYAAAFMHGYTPATLIYDVKKVYQTKTGEGFTPNNYDGRYHGLVLVREALASSLNLPAVEMLHRVGIATFITVAKDLGITTFNQEDRYDLSITLGGGEVTLVDLTNVYASFARGGEYKKPYAIKKVSSDEGATVYEQSAGASLRVLGKNSQQVAYLITHILSDAKARIPSFSEKNPLVLSHPAAVKTGTTTDWHDNWTVGYTPSYTVGVWVGNNDNHPMREITGVVGAAPIWNQFLEEFLKGKPTEEFIRPVGIVEKTVCTKSGELVDELCPEQLQEVFLEGTEPKTTSKLHKKIKIDTRNGLLASEACPSTYVVEKVFIEYPPEVYTWAVQNAQGAIPKEFSPLCAVGSSANGTSYLEVVYPKNKTVFETAPLLVSNEKIVFEVTTSSDIVAVMWYVDGRLLQEVKKFPYSISWQPQLGDHVVTAYGISQNGAKIKGADIGFTVVGFKEGISP